MGLNPKGKEKNVKKRYLLLIFVTILLLSRTKLLERGLEKLSETGFRQLFRHEWAREVFDLDREEARSVFGEEGEAYFL